jgi:2-succinyl-5-enolpyruvyl-6-hydroxy-3-cyclohexene-1-carboxylate synthase
VVADAGAVLDALARRAAAPPDGWLARWQAVAAAAAGELAATCAAGSEPAAARAVAAAVPPGGRLVVSSSMPIRDVERYVPPRADVTVLGNRGANGIDGVVSTALGVAVGGGGPTALLVGDLAFLHDSNGLLGVAGRPADLVVVVVDNDGGGIFSFLPQARSLPAARFETLFGTPHGLDLAALAAAYGVRTSVVGPGDDLPAALAHEITRGGVAVVVVRTDRDANVDAHARLDAAVAAAAEWALAADP